MTPNPSIERAAHGKPWAAAHVKRSALSSGPNPMPEHSAVLLAHGCK